MTHFKNRRAATKAIWNHNSRYDGLVEQHSIECIEGKLVVSYYDFSGAKSYL